MAFWIALLVWCHASPDGLLNSNLRSAQFLSFGGYNEIYDPILNGNEFKNIRCMVINTQGISINDTGEDHWPKTFERWWVIFFCSRNLLVTDVCCPVALLGQAVARSVNSRTLLERSWTLAVHCPRTPGW